MSNHKILIIEDEVLVAQDLKNIMIKNGYEVSGKAGSYFEALKVFNQDHPDLILCDIHLKKVPDGIETISRLMKIKRVPFIFLTAFSDKDTVSKALELQPASYLIKPFTEKQLLIALELAFKSKVNHESPNSTFSLSERETEVLRLLARGKNSEAISNELNISVHTVKTHRKNMLKKLDLKNSSELILWGSKQGYV